MASLYEDGEREPLAVIDCRNANPDTSPLVFKSSGFMVDEGTAFLLVAERFGWTHLLDHRHFATQILTAWHGLTDPKQFQSDVHNILDSPCVETMDLLLKQTLSK